MTDSLHEISLPGCRPLPLASYLKALGVLRVVAGLRDPEGDSRGDRFTMGYWKNDCFTLRSRLSKQDLISRFLEGYRPSTIVDPWNGGSGFYPKDNRDAITAILNGKADRFEAYRTTIRTCMEILRGLKIDSKDDDKKPFLLKECRNRLPDEALGWLDAAFLFVGDKPRFPPLLGTGGNDGRLDFPNNFMQRLCELFDPETGQPHESAESLLREAFYEENTDELYSKGAVGQFDPGGAGGDNSKSGFSSNSLFNPWDYVLMLEGTLVFASAAVRKLGSNSQGALAYPFCVRSSGVGYGSANEEDEKSSRAEMWLPLWEQPATLAEIHVLFAEGRAQVRRRPAKNAVDFARALATYGVDRGIEEFVRYGFHQRNGLAFFAVPLDRYRVQGQPEVNLIQTIDGWLDRYRRNAGSENAPSRAKRAIRRVDRAIMELCQRKGPERVQEVVIALGEAEAVLVHSKGFRENSYLPPLLLPPEWLSAMDEPSKEEIGSDKFREFRLAASLAGIWDKRVGAFREHLEPVEVKYSKPQWKTDDSLKIDWGTGGLLRNLAAVLHQRIVAAIQLGPPEGQDVLLFPGSSSIRASLGDIQAFLDGKVDLTRLEALLKGLVLLDWGKIHLGNKAKEKKQAEEKKQADGKKNVDGKENVDGEKSDNQEEKFVSKRKIKPGPNEPTPTAVYSLLKLTHLDRPLSFSKGASENSIRLTPSISRLVASERINDAMELAVRRLRSSGVPPVSNLPTYLSCDCDRLVASLLFSISSSAAQKLARRLMSTETIEEASQLESAVNES
ncbi:Type I-U CRISPR-associated protein Csx17 [Planctomycetales bacterium 10988]|nr:Type I-U CRISPR-associated protein Csx17 [Planctomycetales bacterium 10988]